MGPGADTPSRERVELGALRSSGPLKSGLVDEESPVTDPVTDIDLDRFPAYVRRSADD